MRRASAFLLALAGCSFAADPVDVRPIDCTGLADGTPCNDRDLCTSNEVCRAGSCVAASVIECPPPGACRIAGTCDPTTGLCSDPPAPDGTPCDDGDLCTAADACFSGECRGVPIECAPTDDCHLAGTCDPTTGLCSLSFAPDGTRCDDGDPCTHDGTCKSGTCTGGEPIDCEENQCITGACDPLTGRCEGTPIADGTPCNDRSACTRDDTCMGGACIGDPIPCESTDSCLLAECDPELGCMIERLPDGAECDDGNACTTGETCTDAACGGGIAVSCEELDSCHLPGTCDPITGCDHPIAPDGTLCNDGNRCTFNDTCRAGICEGTPIVCMAPTQCHIAGSCDPATGTCTTTQRPDGSSCDDQNACTRTDVCEGGQCVGSDPIPYEGVHCEDGICFRDVALVSGITITSTDNATLIGGGGGFLDYDLDGLLDVIVGTESARPRLYRNLGDGSFADVTTQVNLPQYFLPDLFMGFAAGDYDNDGDPDLYLLARGPNILLRNDGGTFTDVTQSAGVGDTTWSTAAAFGDYDLDGDLDLYVGNYIQITSFPNHTPFPNKLFRNEGDGTFSDVSAALGVAGNGTTLAVTWSDYDGDRDPDLFVCNDFGDTVEPNRLYRNDGGTFTEVSAQLGADLEIFCMGIAPGDYDGDGDLDYYFTNIRKNVLLENRGAAGFVDVAATTGTELEHDLCFTSLYASSWGTGFHDFDADGMLDLYVSTGYIPAASHIANARNTPTALFKNGGAGAFTNVRSSAGLGDPRIGRGVAFGDYDLDGDIDVLQVNAKGASRLWRNVSPSIGAHLAVDVVGRRSNRDAIGARVIAEVGARSYVREVNPSYSYLSISEKTVRFGLGSAASIDRLHIRYPSGTDQTLFEVPANMRIAVLEPLVVLEQTFSSPPSVPSGSAFQLSFQLRNFASQPVSIAWSVRIGTQPGPSGRTTVPASGSQLVSVEAIAPGSSGTVPLFVTIEDDAGAIDQSRLSLIVQ